MKIELGPRSRVEARLHPRPQERVIIPRSELLIFPEFDVAAAIKQDVIRVTEQSASFPFTGYPHLHQRLKVSSKEIQRWRERGELSAQLNHEFGSEYVHSVYAAPNDSSPEIQRAIRNGEIQYGGHDQNVNPYLVDIAALGVATGPGALRRDGINGTGDTVLLHEVNGRMYIALVQRKKGLRQFANPGGFRNLQEKEKDAAQRETREETRRKLRKADMHPIYQGFVADERMTATRYIETSAYMHFDKSKSLRHVAKLYRPGDDVEQIRIVPITEALVNGQLPEMPLYGSHGTLIKLAVQEYQRLTGNVVSKNGNIGHMEPQRPDPSESSSLTNSGTVDIMPSIMRGGFDHWIHRGTPRERMNSYWDKSSSRPQGDRHIVSDVLTADRKTRALALKERMVDASRLHDATAAISHYLTAKGYVQADPLARLVTDTHLQLVDAQVAGAIAPAISGRQITSGEQVARALFGGAQDSARKTLVGQMEKSLAQSSQAEAFDYLVGEAGFVEVGSMHHTEWQRASDYTERFKPLKPVVAFKKVEENGPDGKQTVLHAQYDANGNIRLGADINFILAAEAYKAQHGHYPKGRNSKTGKIYEYVKRGEDVQVKLNNGQFVTLPTYQVDILVASFGELAPSQQDETMASARVAKDSIQRALASGELTAPQVRRFKDALGDIIYRDAPYITLETPEFNELHQLASANHEEWLNRNGDWANGLTVQAYDDMRVVARGDIDTLRGKMRSNKYLLQYEKDEVEAGRPVVRKDIYTEVMEWAMDGGKTAQVANYLRKRGKLGLDQAPTEEQVREVLSEVVGKQVFSSMEYVAGQMIMEDNRFMYGSLAVDVLGPREPLVLTQPTTRRAA